MYIDTKERMMTQLVSSIVFFDQVYTLYPVVGLIFGYMALVSAYSIFAIKIPGFYGFYIGKSDPVTFLSFIYYFSKLVYPLCYTTLSILVGGSKELSKTSFFAVFETDAEYRKPSSREGHESRHPAVPSDPVHHPHGALHVRLLQKGHAVARLQIVRFLWQ